MKRQTKYAIFMVCVPLIAIAMQCLVIRVQSGNFPGVVFWSSAISFVGNSNNLKRDLPIAAELLAWNALHIGNGSAVSGIHPMIYESDISFDSVLRSTRFLDKSHQCVMNLLQYPDRVVFQNKTHTCTATTCEAKRIGYLWHGIGTALFSTAFLMGVI